MNHSIASVITRIFKARRHRRFLSLYDLPPTGSVLDVSCGNGDFLSVLESYFPTLHLHGNDMNEHAITAAREKFPRYSFTVARIESLPYPDETFAAVISAMSFHHYVEPEKAFREVARVLQPGGTFYLLDRMPRNRCIQWLWNFDGCPEPYHFEKYYRAAELASMAQLGGLALRSHRTLQFLSGVRLLTFKRAPK